MEGKYETAPKLSSGTSSNDLEWPLTQISRLRYYLTSTNSKWYEIELYLQCPTNRISCMICRTAPFSMTLNDPYLRFQVHAILWRWISQKRYDIQTQFQWNTHRDLHTPHLTLSFRMILSDLEWFSKIFNDTKRRAVFLRQLCFLLCNVMQCRNITKVRWQIMYAFNS